MDPITPDAMSKHTPGPWTIKEDKGFTFQDGEVDYGGYQINAPDVEQLAYVWRSNFRLGTDQVFGAMEAEGNAKLIAAAPELLEALRLLLADVADYPAWQRPCLAVDKANAAVAKATGAA